MSTIKITELPPADTPLTGYEYIPLVQDNVTKKVAASYLGGSISSISIASTNGFAGTSSSGTTPVITLSTTVSGLLKGNGTAISAATSGTDYAPATSGSSILYGDGAGGFNSVTIGSGVSFAGGTLSATGSGGTVTSVSGTGTVNGLTLTGTVTGSGSLTLGGTLSGVDLTSQITGTLPVTNGGTGVTTLTGYVKGSGTSAFTASSTIPNTDVTGLGTMSTQNASSVTISGGTINGTTIGASSPAAGTFTSVTLTSGTISTTPSGANDIVNKAYADSIATGVNYHPAVQYATAATLTSTSGAYTYSNGSSGVGATITGPVNTALIIDGHTMVAGDVTAGTRVLVKNETGAYVNTTTPSAAFNGAYVVTQIATVSVGWVLTRATDYDTSGSGTNEIDQGDFFYVVGGTANTNTSWIQQTALPITIGTTQITFVQFGAVNVYTAGTGLTLSGSNQFSITNTGVTANTYGSASAVPVLTTNAQGQLTGVTNTNIAIAASQITSGTLAINRGGTAGNATPTAGAVPYGTGTAYAFTAAGTSGQVLTSNGASAPTWTTPTTGTVTSVTATSPVASTGGTTPVISMPAATTSVSGYLTSTDWNTFNNKGSGTITGSGTSNYVSKFTGTTALGNSLIYDNGTNVGIGTASPSKLLDVNGDVLINGITVGQGYTGGVTNTALGKNALAVNTGSSNTAVGNYALTTNSSGNYNIAVGSGALFSNDTGTNNVAVGYQALYANVSTQYSTAVGSNALVNATGGFNTAIGNQAGTGITTQNGCTIIGSLSGTGVASNTILLGTTGTSGAERLRINENGAFAFGGTINYGTSGQVLQSNGSTNAPSWVTPAAGTITGSGTTNFVPKFSSSTALSNSVIYDDGTNVGIGTSSPAQKLALSATSANVGMRLASVGGSGRDFDIISNTSGGLLFKSDLQSNILTMDGITGNLGLGVTPSAWATNRKTLQVGGLASAVLALNGTSAVSEMYFNSYLNTSAVNTYAANGYAGLFDFNSSTAGGFVWKLAPSGTAGNAISFTQAMTLDASGNLLVGTTSASAWSTSGRGLLEVNGSTTSLIGLKTGNTQRGYLYSQGTDLIINALTGSLSLQANGNGATIDSSGNVGIGTSSPSQRLAVINNTTYQARSATATGNYTSGGMVFGGFGADASDPNYYGAVGYDHSTGKTYLRNKYFTAAGGIALQIATSGGFSDAVFIDSSGNVGIGTSSPSTKLDVSVTRSYGQSADVGIAIGGTDNGYVDNGTASSWRQYVSGSNTGQSLKFDAFLRGTGWTERMRIDSSGNLGIGTSSSITYKVDIDSTGTAGNIIRGTRGTSQLVAYQSPNSTGYVGMASNHSLSFVTNDTVRTTIDTSGNVGIGTSSPGSKLDLSNGHFRLTTAYQVAWYNGSTQLGSVLIDSGYNLTFQTGSSNTERMRIDASGNVGIGTSTPSYKLQLSTDSAAKPSTSAWTIASDERIKTVTGEYTKGLEAICALRPVTYEYNGKAGFTVDGKENISIIAQEAIEHFPECVGTFEAKLNENDETTTELYNWNGHALTFALVNAIKEQQALINQLTTRIAVLEAK